MTIFVMVLCVLKWVLCFDFNVTLQKFQLLVTDVLQEVKPFCLANVIDNCICGRAAKQLVTCVAQKWVCNLAFWCSEVFLANGKPETLMRLEQPITCLTLYLLHPHDLALSRLMRPYLHVLTKMFSDYTCDTKFFFVQQI